MVPTYVLLPLLAAVLVMSAVNVWRHQYADIGQLRCRLRSMAVPPTELRYWPN
jgi:hypothetical protein